MSTSSLMQVFIAESEDLLSQLESGLVSLEEGHDPELVNSVFRAAHTMKGNAGMVGLDEMVDFTHNMEGVLERVRGGEISVSPGLVTDLLGALDILREMVDRAARNEPVAKGLNVEDSVVALQRHLIQPSLHPIVTPSRAPKKGGPRIYRIVMRLMPELFETGQDPLMLIEELGDLGKVLKVKLDHSELPSLEEMDPHRLYLRWEMFLQTEAPRGDLEAVFLFVMDDNEIAITDVTDEISKHLDLSIGEQRLGELLVVEQLITPAALDEALKQQKRVGEILVEAGHVKREELERVLSRQETARSIRKSASLRVDAVKLDKLVNLVGELVISVAQVAQAVRSRDSSEESRRTATEVLERITREMQEQVMQVRMVPVEETFHRFRRVVRDLAGELGKKADLETIGTETELDKTMIEQLVDPLKHMVRNCIDHGLETPEERVRLGKPETGTIRLSARQREGHIVVEVRDDGRGIRRDAVRRKAIERGLIDAGAQVEDRELLDLIFHPGFSTAEAITEISGRGVGLDVVRRNVEELRGTIELESEEGKGTTFRIQLPLTLAIIDGMTVVVGSERLTLPLHSVVELFRPQANDVKTVEGRRELVQVRGDHIPMLRLDRLLGIPDAEPDLTESMVVVVDNGDRRMGVLVDRVLGMEQAVVKSLDSSFLLFSRLGGGRRPDGIAGATILGDGSVSMILDMHGIERAASQVSFNRVEDPSRRAAALH